MLRLLRRPLLRRTGAITATSLGVYGAYTFLSPSASPDSVYSIDAAQLYYAPGSSRSSNHLHLESQAQTTSERATASAEWVPPTRDQMLQMLKGKSAAGPQGPAYDSEWVNRSFKSASATVTGYFGGGKKPPGIDNATVKFEEVDDGEEFDLLIVGGGATGAGCAVDAASRGLKVALVERDDFSSGTSSKSTKLVHGGVRYLQKAVFELDYEQYKLVREALHERKTFLHTAPYLSHSLPIMLPIYKWWLFPYYYAGTKAYDLLAGSQNMESSYILGRGKALEAFPLLKPGGLCGAVVYFDGQHNDSRMNMSLIVTAVQQGAVVANHVEVIALIKNEEGQVRGARLRDEFTKEEWNVKAKGVINATGPFTDGLRTLDEGPSTQKIVSPSSGVHIVFPGHYAPSKMGLLDPSTSDGTTDAPAEVEANPIPRESEIQWILDEVRNYLSDDITIHRGDVLSAWSGLRPLVKDPGAKDTQSLVRNHMMHVSQGGLLTISGGKWTTYRAMAEETIDKAIETFGLQERVQRACITKKLRLVGSEGWNKRLFIRLIQEFGIESDVAKHLSETYGSEAWKVLEITEPNEGVRWPVHGKRIDPVYPYLTSEIVYACRREFAMTAVDIIARRTRLCFLNSEAALDALPAVIDIMGKELNWSRHRKEQEFKDAARFLLSMGLSEHRIEGLTLDMVAKGKHRDERRVGEEPFGRTLFSVKELEEMKKHKKGDLKHTLEIAEASKLGAVLGGSARTKTVVPVIPVEKSGGGV